MAISPQDLVEYRKGVNTAFYNKTMADVARLEKYFDNWLKNNPNGGTFYFNFLWCKQPINQGSFDELERRYVNAGWKVYKWWAVYGTDFCDCPAGIEFKL